MGKKNKKHLLKDIHIDEVSLVPGGLNQGAFVALTKINNEGDEKVIAKQSFNEALQTMELSEKIHEWMNNFYDMNQALRMAVSSIIRNPAITQKKAAIIESLSQFQAALNTTVVDADIMKGITAAFNTYNKENDEMKKDKKEKTVEDITKEFTDKLDKMKVDMKLYKSLSEMTDVEKEFYSGLKDKVKEAFLAKSTEDREVEISKAKESDESFEAHGQTIQKSVVGEESFKFMKAQHEENVKIKKDAAEEKTKRENVELAKEADEMLPTFPGSTEDKVTLFKSLNKMDKKTRKTTLKMLKKSNNIVGDLTKEKGHSNDGDDSKGDDKLTKMAKEYQEKHASENVSFAKAYTKVLDTPEGQEAYSEEENK